MNLAAALALEGKKVCVVDFDPQANATVYLDCEPDENTTTINDLMMSVAAGKNFEFSPALLRSEVNGIDFIPAEINLSNAEFYLAQTVARENVLKRILAADCFDKYDYIIIDCLPSLGILLMNALAAAGEVIIPVQTQKFALQGLAGLMDVIEQVRTMINGSLEIMGVLPTMADGTNMSRETEKKLREVYGDIVLDPIHRSVEAAYSSEKHRALCLDEKSRLGGEYRNLAKFILKNERS